MIAEQMFAEAPPGWTGGKLATVAEVLAVWPDAVWMPWDPVPLGQRVIRDSGDAGEVIGAMPKTREWHHCPTCTCHEASGLADWWNIRLDNWYRIPDGTIRRAAEPVPESSRITVADYPPSLKRAP